MKGISIYFFHCCNKKMLLIMLKSERWRDVTIMVDGNVQVLYDINPIMLDGTNRTISGSG